MTQDLTAIPARALVPLTIYFGSETGNAAELASRAAREAKRRRFAARVVDMCNATAIELSAEQNVLIITSTYGYGEPPGNAWSLYNEFALTRPEEHPPFAGLRYSVCALGDSEYADFCQCGLDFDRFLEQRGATRVLATACCDVDYEPTFDAWLEAVLPAFGEDVH